MLRREEIISAAGVEVRARRPHTDVGQSARRREVVEHDVQQLGDRRPDETAFRIERRDPEDDVLPVERSISPELPPFPATVSPTTRIGLGGAGTLLGAQRVHRRRVPGRRDPSIAPRTRDRHRPRVRAQHARVRVPLTSPRPLRIASASQNSGSPFAPLHSPSSSLVATSPDAPSRIFFSHASRTSDAVSLSYKPTPQVPMIEILDSPAHLMVNVAGCAIDCRGAIETTS